MTPRLRIGVDLGGTKIEAIAIDERGESVARRRIAAPRGDYAATIEAIAGVVASIEGELGEDGTVGVGMPGSISPATRRVQNANSTWLNGRAFDADLGARLGRPVRLANDANCFALSEAVDGAGAEADTLFGVILGTGCGGGLVVGRRVMVGRQAIAGEWGHTPLPSPRGDEIPGPSCWCGRSGCMESWVSGPALAADHVRHAGRELSPEAIVAEARSGGAAARATLDRHAARLARGLAVVVNIVDPDVIVLGGGLSSMAHLYRELPERMAPDIFADRARLDIRPPAHGDAGGVRGAAWLWGGPAGKRPGTAEPTSS